MTRYGFLLLPAFLFFAHTLTGQNLVINPGFEDENLCERGVICSPKGWYSTQHESVTYYYPSRKSRGGSHQMGLYIFDSRSSKRTYVQTPLKCELVKGEPYKLEMYVRARRYASNFIQVYFSPTAIDTSINTVLSFSPQVSTTGEGAVYDKDGDWIKIEEVYIAQGGERFMVIGNFEKERKDKLKRIGQKLKYPKSFYYIDDISLVSLHDLPLCDYTDFVNLIYRDSLRHPYSPFLFSKEKKVKNAIQTRDTVSYAVGKTFILKNILFETAQSKLLPESFQELDKLLKILSEQPSMEIEILGHTDNIGTEESNQLLSLSRAQAVAAYLREKGIAGGRLSFKGFGSRIPLTMNTTEQGRKMNRRVEFKVIKL